ncbi:eCIS core domain-containing protein [Streptomyces mauvecolor]
MALQASAGNAAVVQMLRQAGHAWAQPEQHQHGAGCGHQRTEQPAVQRSAVHDVLRAPGKPMDEATRSDMEARLGADFSDVRIHNDSAAKASAAEVGARAYTSGSHVVIGDGGADKHTLAHELTHVIQQRQGPVAGTDNGSGLKVSDPSDRYEREAEANATRVMRAPVRTEVTAPEPESSQPASGNEVVQRALDYAAVPNGYRFWATTDSSNRAVTAQMINDGSTTGSTPFADPPGYDYIRSLALTSSWVRFHLVNNVAGGPGSADNLVPAHGSDNQLYERGIEAALKDDVDAAAANPQDHVYFGVEVEYGNTPQPNTTALQQASAPNFPTRLAVYHKVYSPAVGWQWRHNGTIFPFRVPQPTDTRQPMSLSQVDLPTLRQYTGCTTQQTAGVWNQQDVDFLQAIAGQRRAEFIQLLNGGTSAAHIAQAFSRIPFAPPRANARAAAQVNVTTFDMRITENHAFGTEALDALIHSMAAGVLHL